MYKSYVINSGFKEYLFLLILLKLLIYYSHCTHEVSSGGWYELGLLASTVGLCRGRKLNSSFKVRASL